MLPATLACVPTMERIKVVFPHPEGPKRPVMEPRSMCSETLSQATVSPRWTVTEVHRTAGCVAMAATVPAPGRRRAQSYRIRSPTVGASAP